MKIDYAALAPGRHDLLVHVAERPAGSALALPVTVLVGRQPRPRLAVVAGVHGNEFPGPLAVGRLARSLRPESLAGTVVLVPVANPLAFDAGTRVSPEDGVNLNRVFPGSETGSPTLRLAWALVHGIVQDADLAIDLHSATHEGVMVPLAGFRAPPPGADASARAITAASARAAAAFGDDRAWLLWLMAWAPGTLSTALNALGVPAVGAELGGAGQASEDEVTLYEQAVRRCIAHLDGDTRVPLPSHMGTMEDVIAPSSGLVDLVAPLGSEVADGQAVAHVLDVRGQTPVEVVAPFAGKVVHARVFRMVRAGETVVSLSRRVANPVA